MNGKLIAILIISLVAGIGVGYAISLPQILELRSEVSTLRTNYNNLNETYNELLINYTLLIDSMGIRFMDVISASMEPTLEIGDVVVVRRVERL